jgi:hypothetical protein
MKKVARRVSFVLGSPFDPQDGGHMLLRNTFSELLIIVYVCFFIRLINGTVRTVLNSIPRITRIKSIKEIIAAMKTAFMKVKIFF